MNSYSKSALRVLFLVIIVLAGHLNGEDGERERHKRTIGGSSFSRGQYPFLVLFKGTFVTRRFLNFFPLNRYRMYCGGALISNQWLLSAAHCFADMRAARRPGNWEARMGSVSLRAGVGDRLLDVIGRITNFDELRQWEVDVDRIVIHPRYNATGILTNDIALVKLDRPIPSRVSSLINPISLPLASDLGFPGPSDECVTMGWGCTAPGEGVSRRARLISMPIRSPSTCNFHYNLGSMNKRICAGYTMGGIGVCRGDSGSPLVCRRGNTYKLAGAVSLTSRHRPESFPAVFAAVQDYLPWIQQVLRDDQR